MKGSAAINALVKFAAILIPCREKTLKRIDTGDDEAGSIEVKHRATTEKERTHYLASDGEDAWRIEYEDVLIMFGAA